MSDSDSTDKTIKRFHFYTAATVPETERWLSCMAEAGWRLIAVKGWVFTFIGSKPIRREYFIYDSVDRSRGIFHDYHMAKVRYGAGGNAVRAGEIFEVDLRKKDSEFEQYTALRTRYYRRYYFRLLIVSALPEVFFAVLGFRGYSWVLFFAFLPLLLYAGLSLLLTVFTPSRR